MYDFDLLEMDFNEAVTMLTQYAHECEPVDIEAVKELYKDEVLTTEIENDVEKYIYAYNEFLFDNNYYDDKLYQSLNELMAGASPEEVARAVSNGDYNYKDPYVRFDGYRNVESLKSYEVGKEMIGNDEFLNYLIENNVNFDEEEYSELIKATNKELRKKAAMW